jgi:hypothetical protein
MSDLLMAGRKYQSICVDPPWLFTNTCVIAHHAHFDGLILNHHSTAEARRFERDLYSSRKEIVVSSNYCRQISDAMHRDRLPHTNFCQITFPILEISVAQFSATIVNAKLI